MIKMKFKRKTPVKLIGVGEFKPKEGGREVSLPDAVAQGLIDTKDPDWERVEKKSDQTRGAAPESVASQNTRRNRP